MNTALDVLQLLLTLSAIFGAVVYIHQDIRYHMQELRHDITRQSERTDKLYEMFIDLVRGGK